MAKARLSSKCWRGWGIAYGGATFEKMREGLWLTRILVAWLGWTIEERVKRLRLKAFVWQFWRAKVLRVAKTYAVARNFFAVRCGWSAKVRAKRRAEKTHH